jgi:hypothetical protein
MYLSSLIQFVAICDFGEDSGGGCLQEKTLNASHDTERNEYAVCNCCGRQHDCAIISVQKLRLRPETRLIDGMDAVPVRKLKRPIGKRAGLKKPAVKKKIAH